MEALPAKEEEARQQAKGLMPLFAHYVARQT
jgi:hypothetical protein